MHAKLLTSKENQRPQEQEEEEKGRFCLEWRSVMEAENSRSKGLGKEFEGNGGQKLSSSSEHHINNNGLQFTSTKPDSFVVDMERFEKDINSNSRITLQRNLSRKGSQMRSVEKKIPNPNVAVDNLIATSPRAVLHGAGTPEKPMVVVVGAGADHSAPVTIIAAGANPLESKTMAAAGGKRFGFRRPSLASWILDPRRILFFFATLSSMGTLLLIYLSLSVGKYSGDE
ncbi:uncharacterized protein LOC115999471 isoform X2 [Ipomoea triloba]|uniref:uncharacterized protein LOC115999471 isoform X2 n=1 Tax=Ipomoea triloba TaxID=35885 RepID=UPI00125D6B79|nr:uncharacterized protein LOC115999471 isoform X2 [Ipomoea triloba]